MGGECTVYVGGEPFPREVDLAQAQAMLNTGTHVLAPAIGNVYAPLLNDRAALAAMDQALHEPPYKAPPQAPILYIKPRNTLAGPGAHVAVPDDALGIRIGGSLGVVIGRTATRVKAAEALDYVAGFTIVGDLSVPHESVYRLPLNCQARDGFCVIGPVIVPRESAPDPDALDIRIDVSDAKRTVGNTSSSVRGAARLLADVTEFMTLVPGDVLTLGVLHDSPVGHAGSQVSIRIADWPALNFSLVADAVLEDAA